MKPLSETSAQGQNVEHSWMNLRIHPFSLLILWKGSDCRLLCSAVSFSIPDGSFTPHHINLRCNISSTDRHWEWAAGKNDARPIFFFFNQLRGVWELNETLFDCFLYILPNFCRNWKTKRSPNFMVTNMNFPNLLHGVRMLIFVFSSY